MTMSQAFPLELILTPWDVTISCLNPGIPGRHDGVAESGFHTGFLAWEGKLFVHQQSAGLGAQKKI